MRGFSAPITVLAALCCAAFSAATAAEEAPPAQEKTASVDADIGAASDENAPSRMCFGGYEDGKVIVPQGRVKEAGAETTATACRIDGGSDARAPQSPLLSARRFGALV